MIEIDKIDILFKLNITAFNYASKIIKLISLPSYIRTKNKRLRNKELLEKKKFDKCYIIGLGPSLKDVKLNLIDGDSIVVNNFFKIGKNSDFTPTFYMAVDGAFTQSPHIETLYEAMNHYKNQTNFILSEKIAQKISSNNELIESSIYSVMGGDPLFNANLSIDFTKRYPVGFNVVTDAIMMAIYLGYKEIILLGADFNSFAFQKSIHAYEEKDNSRQITLTKELFCYSFVAHVHSELQKYSEDHEIKIVNATKGSLIDAYRFGEEYNFLYENK